MATKTDISFFRGEDVTLAVTITGTIITGWGLSCSIGKGYGQTVAFTKTVGTGIAITDGAGGKFEVSIADTDTDALSSGKYVWDIKRSDAGQEVVLCYGELSLKPKVAA